MHFNFRKFLSPLLILHYIHIDPCPSNSVPSDDMSLIQTCAVLLLIHFSQGREDYWADDFDENKNCARQEEINQLRGETDNERCASAGTGHLYLASLTSVIFLIFLCRVSETTMGRL